VRATIRKQRTLYLVGPTRVHLDRVEGLGDFLELEVVVGPGQSSAWGVWVAERLMERLEVDRGDLIESSYVDLVEEASTRRSPPAPAIRRSRL